MACLRCPSACTVMGASRFSRLIGKRPPPGKGEKPAGGWKPSRDPWNERLADVRENFPAHARMVVTSVVAASGDVHVADLVSALIALPAHCVAMLAAPAL